MNDFLGAYICKSLKIDSLNSDVFLSTKKLFLDDLFDLTGLSKFTNLEELSLSNMLITYEMIEELLKLKNLKKLFILNSNINLLSELSKLNINELYIYNSLMDDYRYINNFSKLKYLYLLNCNDIDLDNLSIIRKLIKIYFDGTKINNTDLFFYMNNCEELSLSFTKIKDISLLCSLDSLKKLYIDNDILKNNIPIVEELKQKGVVIKLIGGANEIL